MRVRKALTSAGMLVWPAVVFGAWIAVDQGYTESPLAFSNVPGGSTGAFAGALALVVMGWVVLSSVRQRYEVAEWQAVGEAAGLQPASDEGNSSDAALQGRVDGRSVTARYEKRKIGGGTEGGGSFVTFTFGEAALSSPTDEGVVVGTVGGSVDAGVGTLEFDDMAETVSDTAGLVVTETEGLVLVGTSEAAVAAVADGPSGEVLQAVRDLQIGSIGDGDAVVSTWAEARNEELAAAGSSIMEYPVDNLVERVPGDAATVTVETRSSMDDGEILRRFLEGVVVVADAFETATARRSSS